MQQSEKDPKNRSIESPTDLYRKENEYVLGLPREVISGRPRKVYPDSAVWLMYKKLTSLRVLFKYAVQTIALRKWLMKTWRLKSQSSGVNAIVIGNGPSQGFIDELELFKFKSAGGELICINFWTENEVLRNVIPTHMVTSDAVIFSSNVPDHLVKKHERLLNFMLKNETIMIGCPLDRCSQISSIFGSHRVFGFVDQELRMWTNNINPMYPRGYLSMTLYKALAIAIWFGYEKIYLIGMDNTYPRNIYCDENNKYVSHEIHAGSKSFSIDQSAIYGSIGDVLMDLAMLYHDVRKFKSQKIINLDPYSLTDAFKKSDRLIKFQKISEMPQ
jgi:hypothetical protein